MSFFNCSIFFQFFMHPLKEKGIINSSTFTSLFGNIETIYRVNGELLRELKQNPENIATAFLKLAPFFKLYSVYAYDYKQILMVLQVGLQTQNSLYLLSLTIVSLTIFISDSLNFRTL